MANDSRAALASAFINQPNEKAKRLIYIIISSALALFLASAFVLVAMLPSPNELPFPHIVIRSPVTNLFVVRSDDKSSSLQQHLRYQIQSTVGKSYASKPLSRSNIVEGHEGAAKQEETSETTKSKEKSKIVAQTNIQADVSTGNDNSQHETDDDGDESGDDIYSQNEIGGDDEVSIEESEVAGDEGNSQNEIGDDDEKSDEENSHSEVNGDDDKSIDESKTPGDDSRLIHILETRFMQNQPNLVELAKARLHLFKTICLPTVIHQSSWGDFLWIIRTDPELHDDIKKELVHILNDTGALTMKDEDGKEKTLTYVIGSNDNYVVSNITALNVRPFDIRAMLSSALSNPETIFSGKATSMIELLDMTSQPRFEKDVVIWTRLDADDGLNRAYMGYIQNEAIRYFMPERYHKKILTNVPEENPQILVALSAGIPREMINKRERKIEKAKRKKAIAAGLPTKAPKSDERRKMIKNVYIPPEWSYWCAGRNLDWFITDPVHDPQHKNGTVYPVIHVNMCVTPGVTIALRASFDPLQIPRLDHDKIIPYLRKFSYDGQLDGQLCARTGRSVFDMEEGGAHSYQVDDGTCFHLVTVGIAAIRSRTPTSAGMLGVAPDSTQREITRKSPNVTHVMWSSMKNEFRISDRQLVETNLYFADHIYDIAEENARGQCTTGHSCKSSSKDSLQRFGDLKGETRDGFDVVNGKIVSVESNITT